MCECSRFEHVSVSLEMKGNFCFLQLPYFVTGNFYRFKNEGYLLEVLKMRFFLTELCLYMIEKNKWNKAPDRAKNVFKKTG